MKKTATLIFAYLVMLVFVSCKSKKIYSAEKQEKQQEVQIKTSMHDTVIIERSKAVFDTVFIQVPKIVTAFNNCDSLCNQELSKYLTSLQYRSKKNNATNGFYYDKYKNQLVLYNQLKEQVNKYQSKEQSYTLASSEKQTTQKEIIKEVKVRNWNELLFAFICGVVAGCVIIAKIRI